MRLHARPAIQLLAALALLGAAPARAGVTGAVELQGQAVQTRSQPVGGSTQTSTVALLMESLSLHYAGLPFGPAVAIATAGGSFTRVDGWYGDGLRSTGQVLTFDTSLGLLPRRAVPLRLFAGGSVVSGTSGALATHGGGPSLLYGGALSLEPGRLTPGLRLDVSESRSSRPGIADLSDRQRRLTASAYDTIKGQRLNLAVRLESDHREGAGDVTSRLATLDWSSTLHQTTLLASEVRRTLPFLGGITSDRLLSGNSEQRWGPALATQVAGRLSEVGGAGATGQLGDARAGFTWRALQGTDQLTFSAGANGGFTRTSSGGSESNGSSRGAAGRASYGRALGPLSGGLSVGASTNTCACSFGNAGTATLLDATASLALVPAGRASGQADYTIVRALAPLGRGGDRLENHARAFGWLAVGEASNLSASLAWDDGVRELLDITTGTAASLHERGLSGSLGAATRLGAFAPSAEVRHARNTVVTDGSPFVVGSPTQVRSVTSALAGAWWTPRDNLGLQAQLRGSWAETNDAGAVTTLGTSLSIHWRLGRLLTSLQYQGGRTRQAGSNATLQQSIMATLSRPFEL